jgi:hypothetical protein
VNIALRANDVYDWTPQADTRLFYCSGDEQVAYQNSLIAEAKMIENGAQMVVATELGPTSNHTECVTPAATNFVLYLLLNATTTSQSEIVLDNTMIYPNPTNGNFSIKLKGEEIGSAKIYNTQGQLIKTFVLQGQVNDLSLNIDKGIYFINILLRDGKSLSIERLIIR